MLIPIRKLKAQWKIPGHTRVIHVGAHQAQEYSEYKKCGWNKVVWIEGNPKLARALDARFANEPDQLVVEALCSDLDGPTVRLHLANMDQSSSVLPLGSHSVAHPEVRYVDSVEVQSRTLDSLATEYGFHGYQFLNLDVQGAEKMVLDGATEVLRGCDYVYSEVNEDELYKGCTLKPDFDIFLDQHGFSCVQTEMTEFGWRRCFLREEKPMTHFKIVVASWNAENWLGRCMKSIEAQSYRDFEACIVVDGSDDGSAELVSDFVGKHSQFKAIINTERGCTLKSQHQAIEAMNPADDDVIVWLDGDDRFHNEKSLATLAAHYEPDTLLTYGSYTTSPKDNRCPPAAAYHKACVAKRDYRNMRRWGIQVNHLRTMRYVLYRNIPEHYVKWPDGSWFTVGGDAAQMISGLEMAGDRFKFIPDVLVDYTSNNNNSDWRVSSPEILRTHQHIASLPKLKELKV